MVIFNQVRSEGLNVAFLHFLLFLTIFQSGALCVTFSKPLIHRIIRIYLIKTRLNKNPSLPISKKMVQGLVLSATSNTGLVISVSWSTRVGLNVWFVRWFIGHNLIRSGLCPDCSDNKLITSLWNNEENKSIFYCFIRFSLKVAKTFL